MPEADGCLERSQSAPSASRRLVTRPRRKSPTTKPTRRTSSRSSRPRYDRTNTPASSNLANNRLQHSKGNETAEQEANKEAEKQIEVIKEAGKKNRDTVVKHLLDAVFEVKPVAA